jgi:hypothetical protein
MAHTVSCEGCSIVVDEDDALDLGAYDEAGWSCEDCREEWYREGMAMAAQYVRETAAAQGGCPRCGSGYYDEHMICHACMVNDLD